MDTLDKVCVVCMVIIVICTRCEEYILDNFRSKCLNLDKSNCVLVRHYNKGMTGITYEESMGGKVIYLDKYIGDVENEKFLEFIPFLFV
jgi:hypothetical protein